MRKKISSIHKKKKSNHCLKSQKAPVIIIANEEDPILIESENNNISLFNTPLLEEYQEEELTLAGEAQQMLDWCQDAETSDENDAVEEAPRKFLWPILYSEAKEDEKRRILKSEKSNYRMPVPSSDPSSNKLVPCPVPRQTKHNRRKKERWLLARTTTCLRTISSRLQLQARF